MIIQFLDASGKPVVDATVCVASAPIPYPDIGMISDENGQVQIDVSKAGTYGFSVFSSGSPELIETHLDTSQKRVSLRLVHR